MDILYIVALQNSLKDLRQVKKHARTLAREMARRKSDSVNFGALLLAKWQDSGESVLYVGDNRKGLLDYYPIKKFLKHLDGFMYLPVESEYGYSIYAAFEQFYKNEILNSRKADDSKYKIVVLDFRASSGYFVANEADDILDKLEYDFADCAELHVYYRNENKDSYERLNNLTSDTDKKNLYETLGSRNQDSPFSAASIRAL